jgi:dienelactone hydrolase
MASLRRLPTAANLRVVMCFLAAAIVPVASHIAGASTPLPSGQIIEAVACEGDPDQSYALYLPSAYTPEKRWPIVYAFDPLARGKVPVKLYKDIAEKYGYILAASNNSRNLSAADSVKGATAMWQDTHIRLSLDERRTYTTGFSGGARMAGHLALGCKQCQIAGVIADGAGYPTSGMPSANILYFLAVGDQDFNWPEVITVRREREELGLPYRVQVFAGPHQWAPSGIFQDAIEWMQLKAMQAGSVARDDSFLDQFFRRAQEQADDAAKRSDTIAELAAYRLLVSDFGGLKDVTRYEPRLAALKTSPQLKAALKKEQEQIAMQQSLVAEIAPQLSALATADREQRVTLRETIYTGMGRLKDESTNAKSEEKRRVYSRAFQGLWVQAIEAGQAEFESRHFGTAEYYFELMSELDSDPWPVLLLAETRTAMGNHKQAIKDLREAIKRGLKNPEVLEQDRNLQLLNSDADFQKLLAELKGR